MIQIQKLSVTSLAALLALVGLIATSPARAGVLEDLNALPGVSAVEKTAPDDTLQGLRRFILQIEQPVDHFDASAGKFQQKLVLFHKGYDEPMVLQTSGYSIFSEKLSRIAKSYRTNQIQVEHRFFSTSSPDPKDWSKLTVLQSANDFHNVVTTFKKLYAKRWVNTGASKGGMTSIFHRRFFPNDLDGTVADVAPLSYTTEDPRYIDFVDNAGGPKYSGCRAKLEKLQQTLLLRRNELLPTIDGDYTMIGSKETAYEHATIELSFAFWQYGNPEDPNFGCSKIPSAKASAAELQAYMTQINDPTGLNDEGITGFQPYYYQAAAELGAPASKLSHLLGLLKLPYELTQYLPEQKPVSYTDATMHDVEKWVATKGEGLMFVYGEFDPWTAGAYTKLNAAQGSDNHWFQVAGGNHGSNFTILQGADKTAASDVIGRWLGKKIQPIQQSFAQQESLEDVELRMRRKLRLK